MPSVRITDESDVERDTIPLVALQKEQKLRVSTLARVTVSRDDLDGVSGLTPGRDRVYIEEDGTDTFGGILRTPGRAGARPTLIVDGFEEYLARASQVELGQQKVGVDDDTLIQECITATPQLTAGTLQTVTAGETWIFSGISQLAKARTVEEAAGGELVFNADRTVDYLSQRGSDKTGTTLSPTNGSFTEDRFNVERDGRTGSVTHLSVYGVGQGSSQQTATIVPDADSGSYTNKTTYTHPTWTAGDDKIWNSEKYTNKDLKNVSALQAWGLTLIADLQSTRTVVDTVVKGTDVELGDTFHILNDSEGVDENLRAVEVTKLVGAPGGTRYEVLFSNHSHALDGSSESIIKDQQRYQSAFEGDLTNIQQGPGRGPVDSSHDYVLSVFYPDDVLTEINAQLNVKGLNYRAFSKGAAGGGDHTHTVDIDVTSTDNTEFSNVEETQDSGSVTSGTEDWVTIDSFTPSVETSVVYCFANVRPTGTSSLKLRVSDSSDFYPSESGYGSIGHTDDEAIGGFFPISKDAQNETLSFEIDTGSIDYVSYVVWYAIGKHNHDVSQTQTSDASGTHIHTPNPGILDWDGSDQSPAHYPEDVDVVVNGVSQGTSLGDGSGEFDETVNLDGVLSSGWNTIRLTSAGLGHLDATFSSDMFRQSL